MALYIPDRPDRRLDVGVVIGLYGDPSYQIELERAPDSGGSPGAWALLVTLDPGTTVYHDPVVDTNVTYWYRARHVGDGVDPGNYTASVSSKAGALPVTLPPLAAASVAMTYPVAVNLGGTGLTGYAVGDLLYASTPTALARRAIGSTGQALVVSGGVPTWSSAIGTGNNILDLDSSGDAYWYSRGHITIRIDSDNTQTDRLFRVQTNAGTDLLTITEAALATVAGQLVVGTDPNPGGNPVLRLGGGFHARRTTGPQGTWDYDVNNYLTLTVASDGKATFAPGGTAPAVYFNPGLITSSYLAAGGTSNQFSINYGDPFTATQYAQFSMGSGGTLTLNVTGTAPGFRVDESVGFSTAPWNQSSVWIQLPTGITGTSQYGLGIGAVGTAAATVETIGIAIQVGTAVAASTVKALSISDAAGSGMAVQYGLKIEDLTKGTTDYAIYTGAGLIRFGDAMTLVGTFSQTATAEAIFTSKRTNTGNVGYELGSSDATGGSVFIDLHVLSGADYHARIIRESTANGVLRVRNTGTGTLWLETAGGSYGIGMSATTGDLTIGSLGTFSYASAPTLDQLLSFNGTKWVPRTVQVTFTTGAVTASNLADGTAAAFAYVAPTWTATPPSAPATPTLLAMYKSMRIDMGATPPAGTAYIIDYDVNSSGSYTTNAIRTTGQMAVHSGLTLGNTYRYKVRLEYGSPSGGSYTVYSAATSATAPSQTTEVNAFGLVVASQIAAVSLAAITADLGTITAGRLDNASASPTAGIRLSAGYSKPGTWTRYVDFAATGSNPVFKHEKMSLNADGTASFGGAIDLATAQVGQTMINAHVLLRTSGLAHGMTSLVETDVSGLITYQASGNGGLNLIGFNNTNTAPAAMLQGVMGNSAVPTGTAYTDTAVVVIEAWEKVSTNRTAPTSNENLVAFNAGANARFFWKADGGFYALNDSNVEAYRQAGGGVIQTMWTANLEALKVTGFSLTGSSALSMVDLAGTWNTTGVPTAFKLNMTNTASGAGALLADLQVGGTSKFKVDKDGNVTIAGSLTKGSFTKIQGGVQTNGSTGTINDQSLNDVALFRWSSGSNVTFNGFTGGADGRFLVVMVNGTANTLQLAHEAAGSTAANRIQTPTGAAITLSTAGKRSALLVYDGGSSRWVVVGSWA